jgi:short-subunit dehydrogenase
VASDLARPDAPDEVFRRVQEESVAIDALVNNAGFGLRGKFWELDSRRQLDMIQVNITALVHLTRLFLPGMIERSRGHILNVGSTAGFQPGPHMGIYYASKAFVLSFTEALAEELAGTGVRATCLAPGATGTEFADLAGMTDVLLFRLGTMKAGAVALAGYKAMRGGRVVSIPGLKNKLGAFSIRLSPRFLVRKLVRRLNR